MSNTILPLKNILHGDYKCLVDSFREVEKKDAKSTSVSPSLLLNNLRQEVHEFTGGVSTKNPDNNQSTIFNQFLIQQHPNASIYDTETPIPLFLNDNLFSFVFNHIKPHPELTHVAHKLSLLLCLAFSRRTEALCDKQHPLQKFANEFFKLLSTWEYTSGRSGRAAPELLDQLIAHVSTLDIQSNNTIQKQTDIIANFNRGNIERAKKLEQRLSEAEEKLISIEKQQQIISQWINKKLDNKLLPEELIGFIKNHLIGDLQYLFIHQGDTSSTWDEWQKLLHLFSWIFKQDTDELFQKKLYNALPDVVENLDERYYSQMQDTEKYQEFMHTTSTILMGLIKGDRYQCEVFHGHSSNVDHNVVIKQVVITNDDFKVGTWYLFKNSDHTNLRAKLAVKLNATDTLLFVNYLGRNVYQCTFKEFQLQLASQATTPLIDADRWFIKGLHHSLKQLEIHHRKNLREQQKNRDNHNEEKTQAANKAKIEADRLTQQRQAQQQEQERALSQREALSDTDLIQHSENIERLQIGAWVAIIDDQDRSQRCKLSVKLATTKKYIFTDRLGQPTGDYYLNDLIDLMISGRLSIISNAEKFDNRLEKIVKSLRKD
jgi:hypothetical protein